MFKLLVTSSRRGRTYVPVDGPAEHRKSSQGSARGLCVLLMPGISGRDLYRKSCYVFTFSDASCDCYPSVKT